MFPIQAAAVDAAAIPAESQDLVTMYHALEHVPDPLAVLTTVRTGSGTAVIWSSKCPTSPRACRRRTISITTRIYAHFTGSTLAALGEAAGLRLVETRYTGDRGNVICCFGVGGDERRPPAGLEAAAAHARGAQVSHGGRALPFSRAVSPRDRRLRRRIAENRVLRRLRTVEDAVPFAGPTPLT